MHTEGSWKEQKIKLKDRFAAITDNDLLFEVGKKEEMFEKIRIKLDKTKEEFSKIIAEL